MTITFREYVRKDGSRMLYINRSNKVSVGISAERGFSPYGRGATQGMRNAWEAAHAVIREHGRHFTGDLTQHDERGLCAPVTLASGWVLVGTDVGNIGGMNVGSDGGYLIAGDLIVKTGKPLAEPAS